MNYIYFQTGNQDAGLYPVTAVRGVRQTGDTLIKVFFNPLKISEVDSGDAVDDVIFNVKNPGSTTTKDKFKAFAAAVNQPLTGLADGFVFLASDQSDTTKFVPEDQFNAVGAYTLAG